MNRPLSQQQVPVDYYAAVDLGSNSFHMVIVRVVSGSVQIISRNKQKVRLASGLDEDNKLDDESIQRGLACLQTFKEQLSDIPSENIRIVATATLRYATNAQDFIQPAQAILNNPINVISGEEEALQIYLGVAYTSANEGNTLVIDIGGASTEIIIGRDMQAIHLVSTTMGCVTFMERFFINGEITEDNFTRAQQAASKILAPHANSFLCFDWQQCLGASGTPQAITSILVAQGINDAIRLDYLYELRQQCIEYGHLDQLDIHGLEDSRRIVFPSGLAILIALFEQLQISNMQIAGGALREGILYGMLDNYQRSDRRNQCVNQLISRFHIDVEQSARVSKVAVNLARQMCEQDPICDLETQALISTAAALHEIGLHINYKNYHAHGYYLLSHTDLTGFTQLQGMFIRDLVGMHRQEIDLSRLDNYPADTQVMLLKSLRVLRLAVLLCSRRKENTVPNVALKIVDEQWQLQFLDAPISEYPLIQAELMQESWLQHRAGCTLQFT